jgi:hypothetical protein
MKISWEILFLLQIPISVVCTILIKIIASKSSRARSLALQYFFLFLFSVCYVAYTGGLAFDRAFWILASLGFLNACACYAQWRAFDINLSKASLFNIADDLIAIALSMVLLQEYHYITSPIALGITLSFISIIGLLYKRSDSATSHNSAKTLFWWITIYSVTWGGIDFAIRFFSGLEGLPTSEFLAAFYGGSFVGALVLRYTIDKAEVGAVMSWSDRGGVLILAAGIWTSLFVTYLLYGMVPIPILQPILQSSQLIIPLLIGLIIFRERHDLKRGEWFAIALGVIGGLVIALNF